MKPTGFEPGDRVTLNRQGDLWMDAEARPFIAAECQVIKITRRGLIQIMLNSDSKMTYSAAARNVKRI